MYMYEGGAHEHEFGMNGLTVFFSYSTPIAFSTAKTGTVVRQNDWGVTTGKHLNHIDGGSAEAKKKRVTKAEFEAQLGEVERVMFSGLLASEKEEVV